mmetsp:Transcript_27558/g.85098  ORF Transcript_27558/g.85098 Transcript_27558/m.85098 type:complete len:391 (+) Transcript_27558:673-1845(+)
MILGLTKPAQGSPSGPARYSCAANSSSASSPRTSASPAATAVVSTSRVDSSVRGRCAGGSISPISPPSRFNCCCRVRFFLRASRFACLSFFFRSFSRAQRAARLSLLPTTGGVMAAPTPTAPSERPRGARQLARRRSDAARLWVVVRAKRRGAPAQRCTARRRCLAQELPTPARVRRAGSRLRRVRSSVCARANAHRRLCARRSDKHLPTVHGAVDRSSAMSDSDSDLSESSEAAPSPLRTACVNGSVDAVRICLDRGGDDIDEVDWIGRTPLVDAIQCGRTEVTRMLLDYGADVNWADKAGLTPLHFACLISDQRGCAVAVRWCLDMGAAPRPQRRRRERDALRRQLLFWRVARPARFFWIQHASSGSRRCRRPSSAGRKHTAPHRMPR